MKSGSDTASVLNNDHAIDRSTLFTGVLFSFRCGLENSQAHLIGCGAFVNRCMGCMPVNAIVELCWTICIADLKKRKTGISHVILIMDPFASLSVLDKR